MDPTMIDLDTAKFAFQIHAIDETGKAGSAQAAKERADPSLPEAGRLQGRPRSVAR